MSPLAVLLATLASLAPLIADVSSQIVDDDDDFCVCVEIDKCSEGFLYDTDPLVTAARGNNRPTRQLPASGRGSGKPVVGLDPRIRTCEGIQLCCVVRPGGGSNPRTTPPPIGPVDPGRQGPLLPQKARLQGCGVKRFPGGSRPNLGTRIAGGRDISEETFYGEVPWMARILLNGEFSCGGSLITSKVVLTAAHCTDGNPASRLMIEVGEWDTTSNTEPLAPQRQQAIKVVNHPNYSTGNAHNDVSLVFVSSPFKMSEAVDIVCTPDGVANVDTESCVAAGWGKPDIGKKFQLQPILRKVQMPFMDRDTCQDRLRKTRLSQHFNLMYGFICAGGLGDGDTCRGDGGGPLYCPMKNDPNRMAILGIISWGIDCGKGNPSVFASVPHYLPWITQHLQD